jgi:hypothetical protein
LASLNKSAGPQFHLELAMFTTLVSLHVGCKAKKVAQCICDVFVLLWFGRMTNIVGWLATSQM